MINKFIYIFSTLLISTSASVKSHTSLFIYDHIVRTSWTDERVLEKNKNTIINDPPNIIFILTDDLGYGDIGVLFQNERKKEGKPYHTTPNLDQMAREGMILQRHYVAAPVCAPSRASLLRGVHQGNTEIRNNQFDKALPDNHTLASILKETGYATAIIGKYGLQGKKGNSPSTWKAYPTKRGFDHFFGYVRHTDGHNHYPAHKAPERGPVELYSGSEEISDKLNGCYTTDLFTAEAKRWIIDHNKSNSDQPFFMYLAYDTPHAGLQVASTPYPEGGGLEGGLKFIGETDNYINTAKGEADTYIHPDYAKQDWPEVNKRFASMVRRIDNATGDILQLLKDLKIDDKTLVIFASDNGPLSVSYGYGEYKPNFFESYGNFDGIKRDTWEGGIRTPLLARWPGRIPSGIENYTPTGFHDWLPTFARLANLPAPANTDGVSLLPILFGKQDSVPSKIYIEYRVGGRTPSYDNFHSSHKGMKRGEMQVLYLEGYKGIRYNIQSHQDDFRIYDTKKDPGEENNLAGTNSFFNDLQKKMKEKALQLRRINESASRPYDSIPVPTINPGVQIKDGLKFKLYNIAVPWTPDIKTIEKNLTEEGSVKEISLDMAQNMEDFVMAFEGMIKVPKTGIYKFKMKTDGRAVIRIHDATLIDADKVYSPGTLKTSVIFLERGLHPVQITYKSGTSSKAYLDLKWERPGFAEEPIDWEYLYHF